MSAAPEAKIEALALATATGATVRAWAQANDVPERTAYSWAARPEFKARVAELRADLVNRALGKLARHAGASVTALARILGPGSGASDAVKVQAAKALLSSLIDLSTHAELSARITEMERRIGGTTPTGEDPR